MSREGTFREFAGAVLKMYPLGDNHGGVFVDSMYVPIYPKRLWIRQCIFNGVGGGGRG